MEKHQINVNFSCSNFGFLNLERKYTLELEHKGESRVVDSIKMPLFEVIFLFFKKIFTKKSLQIILFDKFSKIDQFKVKMNLFAISLIKGINSSYNASQIEDALKYPEYRDWYFDENMPKVQ